MRFQPHLFAGTLVAGTLVAGTLVPGALVTVGLACRGPVPTRPDQLAPGTFAATVDGHTGAPDTSATFDDRITGTACRVGTDVLMETSHRSRVLAIRVPVFPDTPTTYPLRARPDPRIRFLPGAPPGTAPVMERPAPEPPGLGPAARGYLTYAGERRPSHGSLIMDSGTVTIAVLGAGDLRGTVRAHLREGLLRDGTEGEGAPRASAELAGVFRVDARDVCEYARPARSGLTRR